jgi:hypothetical protein
MHDVDGMLHASIAILWGCRTWVFDAVQSPNFKFVAKMLLKCSNLKYRYTALDGGICSGIILTDDSPSEKT